MDKELSIEEKAKRYDEAIERAEEYYKEGKTLEYANDIVSDIFPELKEESEDERIRKALYEYFKNRKDDGDIDETWYRISYDKILAWLEKQVEHANFRNKIQVGDKVTRNEDGVLVNLSQLKRVAKKDEKQDEKTKPIEDFDTEFERQVSCLIASAMNRDYEYTKDFVKWASNGLLNYAKHEIEKNNMGISEATKKKLEDNLNKALEEETTESWNKFLDEQCKQKPAELPKGEDYGIDGLYAAIDILQKTLGKVEGYQTDDGILTHKCAISAVKELSKQNPAWSEEDKKMFEYALDMIEWYSGKNKDKSRLVSDWLKSIKNRVQHKPAEWSEEDEDTLNTIINHFKVDIECTDEDDIIKWLKSLKERYTWKPSDEQIEALDYTINVGSVAYEDETILKKLLEQLKQL